MAESEYVRAHILIVDDYQPIRDIVRTLLERNSFRVSEADNGSTAIHKALTLKPDLILLDLAMPGLNGSEVAKVLRQQLPRVPIIVLTMYEGAAEKLLGNQLAHFGITAVISKSTGMNQLVECVERVLFPVSAIGPKPKASSNGHATIATNSAKA